ncbi:hypothetical protein PRIPAC_77981 [Pristionchus pacificus]|uniref:Uncharacterized protein n=1 Tax=Pristionchus pacificus TaxID=54126 RepID=A0A2A6CKS4_PRIPA|nr:hypothetical protein PRIPAC_77981 [Pristionchus pacificus]|eukprot:PDM78621.1 hypothetical protein PRIPAC_31200 [Pristionchus pacificus]
MVKNYYEAVRERIGQIRRYLAQSKKGLRFSRELMTMGIFIFHAEPSLAPNAVTSKTDFNITASGANDGSA